MALTKAEKRQLGKIAKSAKGAGSKIAKRNKTQRIADIVAANAGHFQRGTTLDASTFKKLFIGEFPNLKNAKITSRIGSLPFISAYTSVNRVLRPTGRQLKLQNNNQFLNLDKTSVAKKVVAMEERAENSLFAKAVLDHGLQNRGNQRVTSIIKTIDTQDHIKVDVTATATVNGTIDKNFKEIEKYVISDHLAKYSY